MPIICDPTVHIGKLSKVIGGHVRVAESLAAAGWLLTEDPAETLVVIGPRTHIDDALAFAAGLRAQRPATGVVLVRDEVDVRVLSQALQCGVREVVPAGDNRALAQACERSRQVSAQLGAGGPALGAEPGPNGEIITVFAPKGGVGKTTLATNFGVVLGEEGHRVCVVDLDLASGDIAITMQLDPVRTIVDAVPMAGHLDITGAASLLTHYRHGLHTLLAPVAPGDAEKVNAALVSELLGVLRSMFRYVVVDTPAHLSEHVLTAMDVSARHVLLSTPDVAALKNLRVTQDMLDLLSYPREARAIVLNRSDSNVGLSSEDVERVLRAPIAAHIPSSRAVPLSINNGTPITLANPDHPVSRAIVRFTREYLLGAAAAGAERGGSAGRLGRLRDKRRTA
jgi:Flp pilus assembly CpaE family ATPase